MHFFDLIINLNTESLESIIQRFGGPVCEWSNTIQRNLKEVRASWMLWSQHEKLSILKTNTKNLEKNRQRVEQAQAKKALAKEKGEEAPKKQKKTQKREHEEEPQTKTTNESPLPPAEEVVERKEEDEVKKVEVGGIKINMKKKKTVKTVPTESDKQ